MANLGIACETNQLKSASFRRVRPASQVFVVALVKKAKLLLEKPILFFHTVYIYTVSSKFQIRQARMQKTLKPVVKLAIK